MDETNKEVSAQVLIAKFQNLLNNYNKNQIYEYEMENQALNNFYENVKQTISLGKQKKLS